MNTSNYDGVLEDFETKFENLPEQWCDLRYCQPMHLLNSLVLQFLVLFMLYEHIQL